MLNIGVSTACMYPRLLEEVIEEYGKSGIRVIELFINSYSEMSPNYNNELKKRMDYYGIKVCSVHPFTSGLEPLMFFSEYPRRVSDMLDVYKRFFEICQQLSADVFVLHGDRKDSKTLPEFYAEQYNKLALTAEPFHVTVAQENICRCKSGDLNYLKRLIELLDGKIKFVFDIKQAVRSGLNPLEVLNIMGDRVVHLHLNDHLPQKDCLLPGNGGFDFQHLAQLVKKFPASPSMVIEVYRHDFQTIDDLLNSLNFLCKIF